MSNDPPYQPTNASQHRSLASSSAYAMFNPKKPAKTGMCPTIGRILFGRPFRNRDLIETDSEYRIARFAHFYQQRRWHLAFLLLAVFLGTLGYLVYCISAGGAGIELSAAPPSPYGRETTLARRNLTYTEMLPVYELTCADRLFESSHALPLEDMGDEPAHPKNSLLLSAMRTAEVVMQHNLQMPCICAPLVGYFVRLVAVRTESPTVQIFLLNPSLSVNAADAKRVVVRHTQSAHFNIPDRFQPTINETSDVLLIRSDPLLVDSRTRVDGRVEHRRFDGMVAHCIEECLDLLDGQTIWHKALEQQQAGHRVNAQWADRLKQYEWC